MISFLLGVSPILAIIFAYLLARLLVKLEIAYKSRTTMAWVVSDAFKDDEWHHVAFSDTSLYIDGKLVMTVDDTAVFRRGLSKDEIKLITKVVKR